MAHRLALPAIALLALLPTVHRRFVGAGDRPAACRPEGRGIPPRHWIGCVGDPGPPRDLSGVERILAGEPVLLDEATPEDLAAVPGLSPRLAVEIVRERAASGPFRSVDDLIRVRGIGPNRLRRARPFLSIAH